MTKDLGNMRKRGNVAAGGSFQCKDGPGTVSYPGVIKKENTFCLKISLVPAGQHTLSTMEHDCHPRVSSTVPSFS